MKISLLRLLLHLAIDLREEQYISCQTKDFILVVCFEWNIVICTPESITDIALLNLFLLVSKFSLSLL